jgi:outer membrane immunogenic protein
MKLISIVAGAAALTFVSAPAFAADFSGARIGANVGYADGDGEGAITYAINAGYDHQIGGAVIGLQAEIGDTDETGRDIAVSARAGGIVGERALLYAHAGYTNLRAVGINLDGVRAGAGVEFAVTDHFYINGEYRYSNYELGFDAHGAVVGAGFRF